MKKRQLLLVLATSFLLFGCNQSGSTFDYGSVIDNNNHDVDLTDDVTDDGGDNEISLLDSRNPPFWLSTSVKTSFRINHEIKWSFNSNDWN